MNPLQQHALQQTRRYFFGRSAAGLGTAALASVLNPGLLSAADSTGSKITTSFGELPALHHQPTAKRVIWLFMADAPSQLDLFDYKPKLEDYFDKDLPESIRNGQRITTMTSGQSRLPCAPSVFKFAQHGEHRAWVSELLPNIASIVNDICIVKTMHTKRSTTTRRSRTFKPAVSFPVGPAWEPGFLTGSAVRTAIFRPSSFCTHASLAARRLRRCSHDCGAADSCRLAMPALRCDRRAIQCCIFRTQAAWMRDPSQDARWSRGAESESTGNCRRS